MFNQNEVIDEHLIRQTYHILKQLVGTIPQLFGVSILGVLITSIIQAINNRGSLESLLIPAVYFALIFYNIVPGKSAQVVKSLKATTAEDNLETIKRVLRDVMLQHHIGLAANITVLVLELVFFVGF